MNRKDDTVQRRFFQTERFFSANRQCISLPAKPQIRVLLTHVPQLKKNLVFTSRPRSE